MSKKRNAWLRPAIVGPHFLACTGVGWWLGRTLDAQFDTKPILTTIFIFLGIAAGFLNLFRELNALNREEAEEQAEQEARLKGDHEA